MQGLEFVEKEYKVPNDLPIDGYELDQFESNAKGLNAILNGLTNSIFVNVMQCKTTKHAWEKLIFFFMKELLKSNNPNFKHTKGSLKF